MINTKLKITEQAKQNKTKQNRSSLILKIQNTQIDSEPGVIKGNGVAEKDFKITVISILEIRKMRK